MPHNPINGWLNLYKPPGITSAKAVAIVKKYLKPTKIGHAGTLDPLAEGVLPLALGEATKTVQFCMDHDKEYEFTIKWGEATTTCDSEGEITNTSPIIPSIEQIQAILPRFIGRISQIPPIYSAIKVDGRRAYDLARQGEEVELAAREVVVHGLEVIGVRGEGKKGEGGSDPITPYPLSPSSFTSFRVSCGKGTYVRSLARDIAEALGTFGHVTRLIRTKVGKFHIKNTILLEDIEKTVYKGSPSGILPVDSVLDDIQVLEFPPEDAARLRNGQKLEIKQKASGSIVVVKSNNILVAMCKYEDGLIKPIRVFNL